jgi:hypothetical protein
VVGTHCFETLKLTDWSCRRTMNYAGGVRLRRRLRNDDGAAVVRIMAPGFEA